MPQNGTRDGGGDGEECVVDKPSMLDRVGCFVCGDRYIRSWNINTNVWHRPIQRIYDSQLKRDHSIFREEKEEENYNITNNVPIQSETQAA